MAVVETEQRGQVMLIRMNRPDRMNALGVELRTEMAKAFSVFRDSPELEVAVFTGTGRAFCAGEDMKESVERGTPGRGRQPIANPFMDGTLDKPVIAAVNGFAMVTSPGCRTPSPRRWPSGSASRQSGFTRSAFSIAWSSPSSSCPRRSRWPSTC